MLSRNSKDLSSIEERGPELLGETLPHDICIYTHIYIYIFDMYTISNGDCQIWKSATVRMPRRLSKPLKLKRSLRSIDVNDLVHRCIDLK